MLGRHGIYIRERNEAIVFIVFKGNDLHSGFHPSYTAEARDAWIKSIDAMWESTVERVGLVSYASRSMSSRMAEMSISPPLHFGNHGEPIAHHSAQLNFSQHSRGILGNADDHFTHLGREAIWSFANLLKQSGLSWEGDVEDLYRRVKYADENKDQHGITAPRCDIDKNPELVRKMRGYWQWYETYLVLPYYIRWTKASYHAEQGHLQGTHQHEAFSAMEMSSITSPLHEAMKQETAAHVVPIPKIDKILHRSREDGEIVWTVSVLNDGISVQKKIPDDDFQMFKSRSTLLAWLELNYLSRNLPSSLKDMLRVVIDVAGLDMLMDVNTSAGTHLFRIMFLSWTQPLGQTEASVAAIERGPSDSDYTINPPKSPPILNAAANQPPTSTSPDTMETCSARNGKQKATAGLNPGEVSTLLNFL